MLRALIELYRQSWYYALACPVLFLIPVASEAAQHVAENAQGFYASIDAARAGEHSLLRMGFGTLKVLTLLFAGYWVVRWLEWREPARTTGFDVRSLRTFLPLLIFNLALTLPGIWVPVFAPSLTRPLLLVGLCVFLLTPLLADWKRTAPIGEEGGPVRSIRRIAPIYLWALAFYIIAILPMMAVHYALSFSAVKVGGSAQLACLAADTIVVGYLGTVLSGVPWFTAERARAQPTSKKVMAS